MNSFNLLNQIEEEKENISSGLYKNLLDELRKYYNKEVYKKFLVKKYVLKPYNKKDDEHYIMEFEEILYDTKIIGLNLKEFNIETPLTGETNIFSKKLILHVNSLFNYDIEEFEDFQSDETIVYIPYTVRYTLTYIQD